jgi:hypothetical protein
MLVECTHHPVFFVCSAHWSLWRWLFLYKNSRTEIGSTAAEKQDLKLEHLGKVILSFLLYCATVRVDFLNSVQKVYKVLIVFRTFSWSFHCVWGKMISYTVLKQSVIYNSVVEGQKIWCSYLTVRHTTNAWHNSMSLKVTFLNGTCHMTVQSQNSTCHQTHLSQKKPSQNILFSKQYNKIPVLPVSFCLSYSACPVLSLLICLSCSAFPVLPVSFCLSCCLSYYACPVIPILSCFHSTVVLFVMVPFCDSFVLLLVCFVIVLYSTVPFRRCTVLWRVRFVL